MANSNRPNSILHRQLWLSSCCCWVSWRKYFSILKKTPIYLIKKIFFYFGLETLPYKNMNLSINEIATLTVIWFIEFFVFFIAFEHIYHWTQLVYVGSIEQLIFYNKHTGKFGSNGYNTLSRLHKLGLGQKNVKL